MAAELSEKAKAREDALKDWQDLPWGDNRNPALAAELAAEQITGIWKERCEDAFRAGYDAGVKDASSQTGVITGVDHATGTVTISPQAEQTAALHGRLAVLERRAEKLSELDAHQVVQLTERVRELEKVSQKFMDLLSAHKFG